MNMEIVLGLIVAVVVYSFLLWLASMITRAGATFEHCIIIGSTCGVLDVLLPLFLPVLIASLLVSIVMFVLLAKIAGVPFWPDAVLMVIAAKAVGLIIFIYTALLIAKIVGS
jgi:hypothetical protein